MRRRLLQLLFFLGSLFWALAWALKEFWRDILGLPGTIDDVLRGWPVMVEEIAGVLASHPGIWIMSGISTILLAILSIPDIMMIARRYIGNPLEILFREDQAFHRRAVVNGDEYDCYFLMIRNRTGRVAEGVRVRIVNIGDADHFSEVDLPAVGMFDPDALLAPRTVDLAPGERRKFQFLFQLTDPSLNGGIHFARKVGFAKWSHTPFPVIVSAFSADASTVAEFEVIRGDDGLSKVIAKRGVTKR